MVARLNPYISFDGKAREAMEFYRGVFGGELVVSTFGDLGAPDPAMADRVMHSQLETDKGFTLMGADSMPGDKPSATSYITVSLSGEESDGLREYWDKLTDGGTVTFKLEKQVWGDEFGQCTDRYGVAWMVNITQPK